MVFDRVTFGFDEHVVFRHVSFTIPRGSMKILLGARGAGKSVLLKLMLGLFRPDAFSVARDRYLREFLFMTLPPWVIKLGLGRRRLARHGGLSCGP